MSDKLLNVDYSNMLDTGELSDTEILVGEGLDSKVFRLHSFVLKIRSPYFRIALSEKWVQTKNDIIKLQKPNIPVEIFDILVEYMYSGTIKLTRQDTSTNIALLIAADDLCLNDLCSYIEEELLKYKESLKHNFVLIHQVTNQYSQFTKLFQFHQDAFQKDPSLIFKAKDFTTIKQDVLLDILESNHLLKPIEVWDNLIEWAIAQTNGLPLEITKWTADNVSTFGNIIQPFISHIDFKEIHPSDFFQKIKPLKDIFDIEFYVKLLEYYSFYDNSHSRHKMSVDSKIINSEQAYLLANFIKIMKRDVLNTFMKFELLVRGSRDGFDVKTFHENCSNKGPTITIACVKGTNEILGGFNPNGVYPYLNFPFGTLSVSVKAFYHDFKCDIESFIFSLDKNNLENYIFSKKRVPICSMDNGLEFGESDLRLLLNSTNKGICYRNSYEKLIRNYEGTFEISDYEVYQVQFTSKKGF
ncbi:16698_t:CDS:2 [Funneliformis mosseae]|uniref:16698_t:CDS:1 n=1 Tax=Funneliformis mosseae TaxID=27381 RepID=A0A9N8VJ36_FUNMO|nr:16698_t:CDS:2 [Funneliformis mosseae]